MNLITEVKSKANLLYVVSFFHCYFPWSWNVIFCSIFWYDFSFLASHPHSKSISSALLDIHSAQQKAYGRLTLNPLVWRIVAVFIIIPNRCLIILRHPLAAAPALRFLSTVPQSTSIFPPTIPLIFMDGVESN